MTLRGLKRTCFRNYTILDFEYEIEDGGLPNVLCLVVYLLDWQLRHVSTIRVWRGEFGDIPPFDIGPDTLVIGYSLWAEMTCFLTLGWKFPVHVYDLHTAFLSVSNILRPRGDDDDNFKKPRKRLSDACCSYGIKGWEGIDKPHIAEAIGQGRWREYGQPAVFAYCEEDVSNSTELFRAQLAGYGHYAPVDPQLVMRWSEYSAKSVARVQAAGMPIDMPLWNLVQENKWTIARALIARLDPSQGSEDPIYNIDADGSCDWSTWRFEQWLRSVDITYWPRLDSGELQIDGDAFKIMYGVQSEADPNLGRKIEEIHALRDSLSVIIRSRIPIGPDGRNRPSLFPFGTATGRNAHAKSLYNAHASMRSFMKSSASKILLYLDWRTQEVGVAAACSGDERLAEDYAAGDVYFALAKMCGLTHETDLNRWKASLEGKLQRQRMKPLQLGINYGMGVRSLARGLDRHPMIASEVLTRHQQRYPVYWAWRETMANNAMVDRGLEFRVRLLAAAPLDLAK